MTQHIDAAQLGSKIIFWLSGLFVPTSDTDPATLDQIAEYQSALSDLQDILNQIPKLVQVLEYMRAQRDQALRHAANAEAAGRLTERRNLINQLESEWGVDPQVAKTLIDIITGGLDEDLPIYLHTSAQMFVREVEREVENRIEVEDEYDL
jgi:hypothetical protein